jgi:hypothetical protein
MQNYKPCSINNKARIVQLIKEVELLELAKAFGMDAYKQMVEEANMEEVPTEMQEILNGGLYEAISFFVYAQYCIESQVADTFTGMVTKNRPDSENVPLGTLKNLQTHNRELASLALEQVRNKIEQRFCTRQTATPNKNVRIFNVKRRYGKHNRTDFDLNYWE